MSEVAGKPAIVGTIIALAKSLDMRVEAEGIETSAQLTRLRELGCEIGQGYYFSKALTPTAASDLIDTQLSTEHEPTPTVWHSSASPNISSSTQRRPA